MDFLKSCLSKERDLITMAWQQATFFHRIFFWENAKNLFHFVQFSLVENSAKERLHFIEFLICRPLPDSVLTFNECILTVFCLGSIVIISKSFQFHSSINFYELSVVTNWCGHNHINLTSLSVQFTIPTVAVDELQQKVTYSYSAMIYKCMK